MISPWHLSSWIPEKYTPCTVHSYSHLPPPTPAATLHPLIPCPGPQGGHFCRLPCTLACHWVKLMGSLLCRRCRMRGRRSWGLACPLTPSCLLCLWSLGSRCILPQYGFHQPIPLTRAPFPPLWLQMSTTLPCPFQPRSNTNFLLLLIFTPD